MPTTDTANLRKFEPGDKRLLYNYVGSDFVKEWLDCEYPKNGGAAKKLPVS